MDHMLAVHVVQRRRDPRADVGDGHGIERRAFGKREKGTPRQVLHHDVGLAREIGGGDEARQCGPDSRGRIICSTSKPTIAPGPSP